MKRIGTLWMTVCIAVLATTGVYADPTTNTIPYAENFEAYDAGLVFFENGSNVNAAPGWTISSNGNARIIDYDYTGLAGYPTISGTRSRALWLENGFLTNSLTGGDVNQPVQVDFLVKASPLSDTNAANELVGADDLFVAFVDTNGFLKVRIFHNSPPWPGEEERRRTITGDESG